MNLLGKKLEKRDVIKFKEFEEVCCEKDIMVIYESMDSDYFLYHEERKQIILCPSSEKKHIDLLIRLIKT